MTAVFGKTITEADIQAFAGVSGDTNPLHLHDEFARSTMFKGRIAHGMLSASFISTVVGTRLPGPGAVYVSQTLNFRAPVRVGDCVTARATVREIVAEKRRVVFDTVMSHRDLKGTETILMVDDEDLLLSMGETILSSYGYRVLTANSGQRALELFNQNANEIDLVITDLVMPTMSGRELAENIHRASPETPILYTSGFVRPQNQDDELTYLQKPFTSQDLLIKIKTVLSGSIS